MFFATTIFAFALLALAILTLHRSRIGRGMVFAMAGAGIGGSPFATARKSLVVRVMALLGFGGNGSGGQTQTAGTVIRQLIPPDRRGFTRITKLAYTSAGTAHTVTCLRPLGKTTVASAGAAGQAVVNFTADPGVAAAYGGISNAIAANDLVAIRTASDGITRLYTVSSVSTLAITMTGNLSVAVAAGDDIWFFGITTDTDGRANAAHPALLPPVSVTTTYEDREGGIVATYAKDEPILVNSNNATAAGTLAQLSWTYSVN